MLGKPLGKQSVSRAVLLFCFLPQPAKQLNCFYFLASQTSIIKKKQTPKTIPQASSSRGTRHSTLPDSQGNSFNPLPLLQTWLFIPCRFRRKKIYIYISLKLTYICCQLPLQGMTTLYCIINVRSHRATYNVEPVLICLTLSTGALHWLFR